jgi:hypothetical protein
MAIEKVCNAVIDQYVQSGVTEKNFRIGTGSRVTFPNGTDIIS